MLDGEETEMRLVQRNGRTAYVPVRDEVTINSFNCWEQAFRVFSNVYTREHPHKAAELIQYNHIIHSASLTYVAQCVPVR